MFKTIAGGVPEQNLIPLELDPAMSASTTSTMVHGAVVNRGLERRLAIAQLYHNAPATSKAFAQRRPAPVPWMYQWETPVGDAR